MNSDPVLEPGWTGEVKVSIFDFGCEPSEVTRVLGMDPSETWKAGELVGPKVLVKRRTHGWVVKTPLTLGGSLPRLTQYSCASRREAR